MPLELTSGIEPENNRTIRELSPLHHPKEAEDRSAELEEPVEDDWAGG